MQIGKHIQCAHFGICSGCSINENIDHLPIFQEAQEYFSEKGIVNVPLHVGEPTGWRYRAKLAIRGTTQSPVMGLYREGTHEVVNIPLCRVHHPAINRTIEQLRQWIIAAEITPYNEVTHEGILRYVQLVVERATQKVQLTLVVNVSRLNDALKGALQSLWSQQQHLLHSLWVNCNTRRDNVIFGKDWHLIAGEELLWENLNGVVCCFHPASFGQANLDLFEKLLQSISSNVPEHKSVVEYYAGSGIIGLNLAKQSAKVLCCEVNGSAEQSFNAARDKMDPAIAAKVSFEVGSVDKKLHLLNQAEVVVVDPPRKGLDAKLLKALDHSPAEQLVYISCGWPSFRRDCDALLKAGWSLQKAEAYLFFPGTNHIETLAFFKRSKS